MNLILIKDKKRENSKLVDSFFPLKVLNNSFIGGLYAIIIIFYFIYFLVQVEIFFSKRKNFHKSLTDPSKQRRSQKDNSLQQISPDLQQK